MAADPRQFTEHNTMGNVSVYLEDKRMEELKSATAKTSSQISTSAQYIPLQDTDGNLVKINPASFEEAVRNVLGSLLANNDKGTTISGLPALSGSGANLDFGSVTPANLASVLGVGGVDVTQREYAICQDVLSAFNAAQKGPFEGGENSGAYRWLGEKYQSGTTTLGAALVIHVGNLFYVAIDSSGNATCKQVTF